MTAETVGIVVGVVLAVAVAALLVAPRRQSVRYDARRDVWTFRTSAGKFRAALVVNDWYGRVFQITGRYRDGTRIEDHCPPAEARLRARIDKLTETYNREHA